MHVGLPRPPPLLPLLHVSSSLWTDQWGKLVPNEELI